MSNSKIRRKKKLNSKGKALLTVLVLAVVLIAVIIIRIASSGKKTDPDNKVTIPSYNVSESAEDLIEQETVPSPTPAPQYDLLGNIYSSEAILIDAGTGSVIDAKNPDTHAFPASVTKMMTLLVACEQIDDYDEVYPLPRSIYDTLYYMDLSAAGYECDEEITINDLLYGLQLRSGAECCLGLAYKVSGTEEAFVGLMNSRAQELGMTGTHFTNCTGLHNEDHYSTVRDMAVLLREGLNNPKFREVFSTYVYTSTPTVYHPGGLTMYSTFYQTLNSMDFDWGSFIGGKTGFTSEAGQCLATAAVIGGREYIFVTFGAYDTNSASTSHMHSADAINTYRALEQAISQEPPI